jgi:DNA invertase Pin-like site-specific DNA recombinase
MATKRPRGIPCAIYTRKSSEEGLEQAFNSLDAQREAAEAFIHSQRHEGWAVLPDRYDDGGISGATMERPALRQLLHDVEAGKVAIVVVYKVDRLTRSLADFAKMIEIFDRRGVSFVSVTQQFNTTTSMGRLTLNVLLSFAQFEREVTGERIRDKIAASKKKGMWMGGMPPFGYDIVDRKLVPNAEEAKIVKWIFQRYLELGVINALHQDVLHRGITTKLFTSETGRQWGGKPFARSSLHRLLNNRLYIGEIIHKDVVYPGEHNGIVEREIWDKVQTHLQQRQTSPSNSDSTKQASLLKGLIYDDAGARLTPIHANKNRKRYRYYISNSIISGARPDGRTGVWRIPAGEIEKVVVDEIKRLLNDQASLYDIVAANLDHPVANDLVFRPYSELAECWDGLGYHKHRALLVQLVSRVVVMSDAVEVHVRHDALADVGRRGIDDLGSGPSSTDDGQSQPIVLRVAASLTRCGREVKLVVGNEQDREPRTDARLITVVARAHRWLDMLMTGEVASIKDLASIIQDRERHVGARLRLAFLAPDIVETILEGRQPPTLNAEQLIKTNIPLDWSEQRRLLGFAPQ